MPSNKPSSVSPRKEAKQSRSRKTVEAILDATLALMIENPADRVTTNAIAARANVSIGSLYQFFPNKEAIFYELFQRWLTQTLNALDGAEQGFEAEGAAAGNPREKCVDAILEALAGQPDINSPGHWQLRRAMGSSRQLAELEAQHLQQILQRIVRLHEKVGGRPPAALKHDLALLQNQITIACLQVLAVTDDSAHRDRVLAWCKKLLMLAFDFDALEGGITKKLQ